mgnify:FL=1|jgi:hypothetical protein|tara:strand:+ start:187 stop:585 length:399 start_codon:yes stop_codon:yes gene_type:complete
MEEDFYATLKLKTGEEIFAKVAASEEDDRTFVLVSYPIIVSEVKTRSGKQFGYKMEPWLKTTSDDMFILKLEDILTMSESSDIEMISMYQSYVRQTSKLTGNISKTKMSRKMGYISNVNDAKEILEKLYKNS